MNRKISSLLTQTLAHAPLRPNHVTTLALVAGLMSAYFMARGTHVGLLVGAAFLHMSFLLDNCDGELARLKSLQSTLGARYDLLADLVVDYALWMGLAMGAMRVHGVEAWPWWALGACMGSTVNEIMVIWERKKRVSTSVHVANDIAVEKKKTFFYRVLNFVSHNGDIVFVVWVFALLGNGEMFLIVGCVYMHGLWLWRILIQRKVFLTKSFFKGAMNILVKAMACLVGMGLLWSALNQILWTELMDLFKHGGYALALSVLIYPIACIFHTLALKALMCGEDRSKVSFVSLYAVRMIGDSINKMTPFIDIGGEPFKMMLLAKRRLTSMTQAVIIVWMSRIAFVGSEIIFILMGWVVLQWTYPNFELQWVTISGMIISMIYLVLLVMSGLKGIVQMVPRLSKAFNVSTQDIAWSEADQGLRHYYRDNAWNFLKATWWQFLGWTTAMFEVYVIFLILGVEITLVQAFVFQSILQVIKTASFLIPANLGAQEKGLSQLAIHMGLSATSGFALSLLKRFRQLVWVVLGLLIWKLSGGKAK